MLRGVLASEPGEVQLVAELAASLFWDDGRVGYGAYSKIMPLSCRPGPGLAAQFIAQLALLP